MSFCKKKIVLNSQNFRLIIILEKKFTIIVFKKSLLSAGRSGGRGGGGGGDNGKLRSAENSRSVFKIKNALGGRGPVPIESSEEKHNS